LKPDNAEPAGPVNDGTQGASTSVADILNIPPYSLNREEKARLLDLVLRQLTRRHYENCAEYRKIVDALGYDLDSERPYSELPFIPVRLFKSLDLLSAPRSEIVKTMTSSGTSGQQVSKIYLDRSTAANQTKALTRIVSSFLGKQRAPMIVIDAENTLKDRNNFSARAAGILGFSIFGSKRIFALDENMNIRVDEVRAFIAQNPSERVFLFGFTFMVWQHFYRALASGGQTLNIDNGVLIHGGGWKKLAQNAVIREDFKSRLREVAGIPQVHDYYGMVEQTGSIYMECEHGYLHAPAFSDVIVRRPLDFRPAAIGEPGIIQLLSILPASYPGHSILTEDEGVICGEDDCRCGRLGKYFKVNGRLKNAEVRGCSDVYMQRVVG